MECDLVKLVVEILAFSRPGSIEVDDDVFVPVKHGLIFQDRVRLKSRTSPVRLTSKKFSISSSTAVWDSGLVSSATLYRAEHEKTITCICAKEPDSDRKDY